MKAKALKSFLHDQLGHVAAGQEFEATAAQLSGVLAFVQVYAEAKPSQEVTAESAKRKGK